MSGDLLSHLIQILVQQEKHVAALSLLAAFRWSVLHTHLIFVCSKSRIQLIFDLFDL